MSQDDLYGAPAGWYPDPLGLPQLRWWNNHAWTEQTSAARQPMVVQDTKFAWADDDTPARSDERLRPRSGDTRVPSQPTVPTAESLRELEPPRAFTQVSQGMPTSPVAAPSAPTTGSLYTPDPTISSQGSGELTPSLDTIFETRPADAPEEALNALFGDKGTRRAGTRVKTPVVTAEHVEATMTAASKISSTGPAWVIAMVPLLQVVLSVLALNAFGMSGSQFIYLGILVLPYLGVIGLAYLDHRMLANAGHSKPAHWRWAVLTAPVYLLVRARAVISETGHGLGPVLAWLGVGLLHLASFVAVPGLLIALLPSVFLGQMETAAQRDALIANMTLTVDCAGNPPVLPGEQMACSATNTARDNVFDIAIAFQRSNGWISWEVVDWGTFGRN